MAQRLYRISDAAEMLGLKAYVLRYWETEFSQLQPVRTGKGQRRYTEADMAMLGRIRYLLHDQGMTIEGARRVLTGESALSLPEPGRPEPGRPESGIKDAERRQPESCPSNDECRKALRRVSDELRALLRLLRQS